MKSLARGFDVEKTVQNCEKCQITRPTAPKAPIHPWKYPNWLDLWLDNTMIMLVLIL